MRGIGYALLRREIYFLIIFFILDGLTNPSFADFTYFFYLNVIGISKFMFAMITLIGQVCQVIGVIIFEQFLKNIEVRWLIFWNVIFAILGAFFAYAFAMRWNLACNINDISFLIFTTVVFSSIQMAFSTLPILSLFAKICPKRIEGTMYAFLTGVINLDQGVLQPMMGSFVNSQFVGVTKDDQSGYPTLMLIAFICSFLGFALLPLIPMKKDIEELREQRDKEEKEELEQRRKRKEERRKNREENKMNAAGMNEGGDMDPLLAPSINRLQ